MSASPALNIELRINDTDGETHGTVLRHVRATVWLEDRRSHYYLDGYLMGTPGGMFRPENIATDEIGLGSDEAAGRALLELYEDGIAQDRPEPRHGTLVVFERERGQGQVIDRIIEQLLEVEAVSR